MKAREIESMSGEVTAVRSRGKKRIGYELEMTIVCETVPEAGPGYDCTFSIKDLCDDGSEPECKVTVKLNGKGDAGGNAREFKEEIEGDGIVFVVVEKCRQVLGIIRDEA